jgi:hypothetical protein
MVYPFGLILLLGLRNNGKPYLLLSHIIGFILITLLTQRLRLGEFLPIAFIYLALVLIILFFMLNFPFLFLIMEANYHDSILIILLDISST